MKKLRPHVKRLLLKRSRKKMNADMIYGGDTIGQATPRKPKENTKMRNARKRRKGR